MKSLIFFPRKRQNFTLHSEASAEPSWPSSASLEQLVGLGGGALGPLQYPSSGCSPVLACDRGVNASKSLVGGVRGGVVTRTFGL